MRYGSVAAMVSWLDRDERKRSRERRMRNRIRKLPPCQRRFALTLRRVLEDVPGPENLQREKNHENPVNRACDVLSDARKSRQKPRLRDCLWRGCDCGTVPRRQPPRFLKGTEQ